jgi:hypothetical protein
MNVILNLDKITYGTLSMIGEDYGIKNEYDICSAEGIEKYCDKVVKVLEADTDRFKEELKDAVINAVKSIKIDIIK